MSDYQPFLVSDLTEGKVTRRDRWLLRPDAFSELNNCHLKRGALEKRRGKSKLGQIVKIDTDTQVPTLQTNPVMGISNYLSGNIEELLIFDKERMNTLVSDKVSSVVITAFADAGGGLVEATTSTSHGLEDNDIVTISGTTNYNGTFKVQNKAASTFEFTDTWVSDDATGLINQEQFTDATEYKVRFIPGASQDTQPAANDVIYGWNGAIQTAVGTVESVIIDYGVPSAGTGYGTIIFQKGTVTGAWVDADEINDTGDGAPTEIYGDANGASSDDSFTGDNTNFFWVENWTLAGESTSYITNNNDPIQTYDGNHLSQLSIDIGTDANRTGDNDVDSALLIFVIKNRIVIFSTTENSVDYKQRARWSAINEPKSWPLSSFKDAPTEDYIVSADLLGDDLYVWFENSVWRFVYTGDSVEPFNWERVSAQDGAIAQMSLTTRNNIQRAVGPTKILANNGNTVGHIDQKIPDVVLDWNPDSAAYSVSVDAEEDRRIYITYARTETTPHADGNIYPDRALIYNYEDDNWAVHEHEIHAMGFTTLESDVTWEIDDAWEDIDFAWNSSNVTSGFPFTLIGDHGGLVFLLSTGGTDEGEDIAFNATTARVNPYNKQGNQAKFWKVEFLCDVDEAVSFDVALFLNSDETAYDTKTITCDPVEGSDSKAWYAVFADAVGSFHSVDISNDASNNRPVIHAMRFWFKPVGRTT